MKKIKRKLIKWLGGITPDEYNKVLEYEYIKGKFVTFDRVLSEMERSYGMAAEEWCDHIYKYVENQHETYMYLVENRKEKILHD